MSRSPSLADRFTGTAAAAAAAEASATEPVAEAATEITARWRKPPSREGRKAIVVHLDPAAIARCGCWVWTKSVHCRI